MNNVNERYVECCKRNNIIIQDIKSKEKYEFDFILLRGDDYKFNIELKRSNIDLYECKSDIETILFENCIEEKYSKIVKTFPDLFFDCLDPDNKSTECFLLYNDNKKYIEIEIFIHLGPKKIDIALECFEKKEDLQEIKNRLIEIIEEKDREIILLKSEILKIIEEKDKEILSLKNETFDIIKEKDLKIEKLEKGLSDMKKYTQSSLSITNLTKLM